jgi:hypothetical protein
LRSEEDSNASATVVHGASLNPDDLQMGPVVGESHVHVVVEGEGEGNP